MKVDYKNPISYYWIHIHHPLVDKIKGLDYYTHLIQENRKVAKELVVQGKLSPEEFELLQTIDPSPTKKYM